MKKLALKLTMALTIFGGTLWLAACSEPDGMGADAAMKGMVAGLDADRLRSALSHSDRPEEERARDKYRHPFKTLEFLGIGPSATVVELWPGGGWYTRVLIPYLRLDGGDGKLYMAHFPLGPKSSQGVRDALDAAQQSIDSDPLYSNVEVTALGKESYDIAPDGVADFVLTFRNLHNWLASDYLGDVYQAAFKALKPGGVFGVVEHRAAPDASLEQMKKSGYVTEALAVSLAEEAGFVLEASLDVNDNPKDTKDHPNGVWSLPPSLRGGDEGRERFLEIGESDRMTLRFRKPLQ